MKYAEMHKRLFRKYYAAFSVMVTITVVVLGIVSGSIIGLNSFSEQSEAMTRAANKVAHSVSQMPKNYNIIAGSIFDSSIDAIRDTIDSDILVFDKDGELTVTTNPQIKPSRSSEISVVSHVLEGRYYNGMTAFGTAHRRSGFTVGVPVISSDNNITGAVFITTSEHNISSIIIGTLMIYLVCGIIILLIAFVVVFFITKSITKPIYNMSEAVHSYARGDYSRRLDVKRSNEFAPLAEAFNSMADGVENLEQMRRGFVADVSHELRTPMTTITGFVDGILDGTIPPEAQEKYLRIVSDEVHRISRMVSSLLDIAKMQSGQITYVMKPFDMIACAGKALFAFEDRITQKNIDLQVEFESDSIIVNGDEDAIYRVVYNLLDNAVKFTFDGGRIELSVKAVDNKVRVSVFNTGKGISREDAAHIFERFYKADKSRSENVRGTGIGLYLVKNIIKAHGEDIILTSKEGESAKFEFTLPLNQD